MLFDFLNQEFRFRGTVSYTVGSDELTAAQLAQIPRVHCLIGGLYCKYKL